MLSRLNPQISFSEAKQFCKKGDDGLIGLTVNGSSRDCNFQCVTVKPTELVSRSTRHDVDTKKTIALHSFSKWRDHSFFSGIVAEISNPALVQFISQIFIFIFIAWLRIQFFRKSKIHVYIGELIEQFIRIFRLDRG